MISTTPFIGREAELHQLKAAPPKSKAQLIAIYGRRRVGKTALVEQAYDQKILWKFEGLEGASTKKQIQHFLITLAHLCAEAKSADTSQINTWEDAFILLDRCMAHQPRVIFFDEFQWMAMERSQVVSIFKWAWDNYFSKRVGCRFILCGSISSFIVKKVIKSKALYGRVDLEINLKPFSVKDVFKFFDGKKNPDEILNIYMTLGGIPQYLLELDQHKSLIQNLNSLAFTINGYFFQEYHRLFVSHFSKNKSYESLLKYLAHKGWATSEDIAKHLNISTGGTLTTLIEDLELAGFIERRVPIDKDHNSRLVKIRICDEYLHFYFKMIEPNQSSIQNGTAKGFDVLTGPSFDQWKGYAFEMLCQKHHAAIARALGFHGIRYRSGPWFRVIDNQKIQLDLVFDRADHVLTLCEIKNTTQLKSNTLITQFDRSALLISPYFKSSIQKVLILAQHLDIPEKIAAHFDTILFAPTLFF